MDLKALVFSVMGLALMYAGILMARKVDNKASASVFRIGGIMLGILLVPMLHSATGSSPEAAAMSGQYLLPMAFVLILIDHFVVKPRQ